MGKNDIDVRLRLLNAKRFERDAQGAGRSIDQVGKSGKRTGALMSKLKFTAVAAGAAVLSRAMYGVGKSFSDSYNTIRVGTGATGIALDGLKGDFKAVVKGVPADFQSASTAVADLNTRLGLTGKPLQAISGQFLELSRITKTDAAANIKDVTRAFGDWEVKTGEQAGTLDKFFRAAQSSGATVGDLAKQVVQFGAPLRQVGFSLDEATAMFASFEKAGVNTTTMMPGIKMAMKTFFEKGIDPKKGLTAAFKGIQDGSIDAAGAIKIFGVRAGGDMIEAVRQGRFDLDKMTGSLVNGSDTIMKAGRDTQDFSEKWQLFKNRVLVKLEPILIRVFDALGTAMDRMPAIAARVTAAIGAIFAPFARHKTATMALATVVAAAVAGLVIYKTTVKAVAVAQAVAAFATGGWVTALWALNTAMRANPIGLIVTGIVLLVAGLVLAYNKVGWFRAGVDAAFGGVKAAFGWVWQAAKDVFGWVKKNWPLLLAILTGPIGIAVLMIVRNWGKIKAGASRTVDWIKNAFNNVVGFFKKMPGRIGSALSGMWNGLKNGFRSAVNFIIRGWNGISLSLNIPDAIPGLPDKLTFGTPDIPLLAKGGTVMGVGRQWISGEAGVPELGQVIPGGVKVTPIKPPAVTPIKLPASAGGTPGPRTPDQPAEPMRWHQTTIPLQVDGKTLAKVTLRHFGNQLARA